MLETVLSSVVSFMGVLMSLSHFPQAVKIYQRKSSSDISLITYSIFTLGSVVWLVYGILLRQWPIILTFIVAVVGTVAVMVLALRYR